MKQRMKRVLGVTSLVSCLALMLSGCVRGSSTTVSSETITMWRPTTSAAEQDYFSKHFVDAYNVTNPKNPIKVIFRDWSTAAQLQQTAVASGSGPDIIYTPGPSSALSYLAAGELLPLDKYGDKYGWTSKFQPWALDVGKYKDQLYLIPETYETMLMVYLPKVFKSHGWDVPVDSASFNRLIKDAHGAGMIPITSGSKSWPATTEHLLSVAINNIAGPDAVYSALSGKKKWTDPEFVDAISTVKQWFADGTIAGGANRYFSTTVDDNYRNLTDGKAATYWNGSWAFQEVGASFHKNDQTGDWDWSLVPSLSSRVSTAPVSIGIGRTMAINAKSKNPDGAAEYINWLVSDPKAQLEKTQTVGVAPIPLKFKDSDFPSSMDPRVKRLYETIDNAKSIGYLSWTFLPPKTNQYFYREMDKVIVGDLSVQDYLAGLQSIFDGELKAGLVPPLPKPAGGTGS